VYKENIRIHVKHLKAIAAVNYFMCAVKFNSLSAIGLISDVVFSGKVFLRNFLANFWKFKMLNYLNLIP